MSDILNLKGEFMIDDLILKMQDTITAFKSKSPVEIKLFHHNDTDGLCSGTILLNAFEKTGHKVSIFSLEKPYPQVLEKICSEKDQVIVFTDFAGKIAPMISDMNKGRNMVIIIDHHPAERVEDETVFVLDGELYGLKGDRDISASATCYLFANILFESFGFAGAEYSHLGALGAIGDGFMVNGALSGVNRMVLKTAEKKGTIRVEESDTGEKYYIKLGYKEYPALYICSVLDTLGGVGYYNEGAAIGIRVCQTGVDSETAEYLKELNEKKEFIFAREIEHLKTNIKTTDNLQWFNVKNRFEPMGVKMIGVFCTLIKNQDFLDETKYLAGFQNIPDKVPGFGDISFNSTKISMRVSDNLTEKIRAGESPGLIDFLPAATQVLGGFSDACHRLSAATTVDTGQEESLSVEIEKELKRKKEQI